VESYISSLHAEKVGLFEELNIKFNKSFNFIVGPNGSGKTSILRCIALLLHGDALKKSRYGEDSELWINIKYNEESYRIGMGKGWVRDFDNYRQAAVKEWVLPPSENGLISLSPGQIEQRGAKFCPLILGAYRRIDYKKIEGTKRELSPREQSANYRLDGIGNLEGTSLPEVKQWIINRIFAIHQDWAKVERENWDWFIENLPLVTPKGSKLEYIEISRHFEPVFSLNDVKCYLEELSGGYQAVMSLLFGIFNWIEGINDEDEGRIAKNAIGTVIIDELDVHMHPEWQFTIKGALEKIFPKLQFITTTHSPHLISMARPNEIIILPEFSRIINVEATSRTFSGWSTDQILQDIMRVKSLENKLYSKFFNEARKCIEQKDIEGLNRIIVKLKEISHPSDTIVKQLEINRATLKLEDEE